MMKKLALVMMAFVAIFAFTACGGSETVASTTPSPAAPTTSVPTVPSTSVDPASVPANPKDPTPVTPADSTPTPEPAAATPAEPEPTDPYELLAISVEEATQTPGTYILRNGKCYNYGKRSADFYAKYGVGYKTPTSTILAMPLTRRTIALTGDFPIIKIEPGDELITVGDTQAYAVAVTKNPGYTFLWRCENESGSGGYWKLFAPGCEWNAIVDIHPGAVKQFEICGADGSPVDSKSPYSFAKGELCTLSWFQGTTYCEYPITADYPSFSADHSIYDGTPSPEGTLTKNGYAVQDLSIYEPGYWLFDQSLILLIE